MAADLECVVNVSEGRSVDALDRLAAACEPLLLDLHRDPDHHRAVLTLAGPGADLEGAVRDLARAAVDRLDLAGHVGCHPRFGVVDVVPFTPLEPTRPGGTLAVTCSGLDRAVAARDRFARWAAGELAVPCFLYGPLPGGGHRSLPEIRRRAFVDLRPDTGPSAPHATAGASAVGARGFLVAYNLWISGGLAAARAVAAGLRGPGVRALGLDVGGQAQVACNLVDPAAVGPAAVHDRVVALLGERGSVVRCELVGLVPEAVLAAVARRRWASLGLGPEATVEARLSRR